MHLRHHRLACLMAVATTLLVLNACAPTVPEPTTFALANPVQAPEPAHSPWTVSSSKNELNGQETIVAVTGFGDETVVIRKKGKALECYLTTGQFLETVQNLDSHLSTVSYKFDDGTITRQAWHISSDNTALFYPGNPAAFLRKMANAKRFVIQYAPADIVPQTASFDVSTFPAELGLANAPAKR